MILVDTMIWADFLGRGGGPLAVLLADRRTMMHPYVRGELSLGNLPNRAMLLAEMDLLPPAPVAEHGEVISLIESTPLFGTGVGYVDAHLIASVLLAPSGCLWTNDKRLWAVADRLGITFKPV